LAEGMRTIPLLVRSHHSAPLGIYPPKMLLEHAYRLGYQAAGVVDRETLAAVPDLGALVSSEKMRLLYALELFIDPGRMFPIILLVLNAAGYHELLSIYSFIAGGDYQAGGLEALARRSIVSGAGLACLVEGPQAVGPATLPAAERVNRWTGQLNTVFQCFPKALFYLRLSPDASQATLDLAARTGLAPVAVPVASFADPRDGALYLLGRQMRLKSLEHEGGTESPVALPALSEELFRSVALRPAASVEVAFAHAPTALENTRRLLDQIEYTGWNPGRLQFPVIQLGRGFNPETYLWDRIQAAAEKRWPDRVAYVKKRLYEEFSALQQQGKTNLFLALCELYDRLSHPQLVTLPDRLTRTLLTAHLMRLTPFDPTEQRVAFDADDLRHLRSPIPLHIPDGFQKEILKILSELFGREGLGTIPRVQLPSAQTVRALAAEKRVEGHPEALGYLRRCGAVTTPTVRWSVLLSRPIDGELPCARPVDPDLPGCTLGFPVESVSELPALVFELLPDVNRTRLWNLQDRQAGPPLEPAGDGLSEATVASIREILHLLYPRHGRSTIWLAFRAMAPRSWNDLMATLALLELERHDRTGFLRAVKRAFRLHKHARRASDKPATMEQGRKALAEVLAAAAGLFLFRDQMQPLFERVLDLPEGVAAGLARKILAGAPTLPSTEQIVQEIVTSLDNPDVTYLATQYVSLIPRYLCSRPQIAEWAKNLVQLAALAEERPLQFACEVLDVSPQPGKEVPAVRLFLKNRGKRLLPPDVNRSESRCSVEREAVRLGLSFVENIGPVTSLHLIEKRKKQPFRDIDDLLDRTSRRLVNRRVLRQLALHGALDPLAEDQTISQRRLQILERITLAQDSASPSGPEADLQPLLFDLALKPSVDSLEPEPDLTLGPLGLIQEECRVFSVPLAWTVQRAVEEVLPAELSIEMPSRHHWWLGRQVLQAGVLRDIWPWLESEAGHFTLATLYSGDQCFLVVAGAEIRSRLTALADATRGEGGATLMMVLGRLGGRPKGIDRVTLGLLPRADVPRLLHQTPHFLLEDFQSLESLCEGVQRWNRIEVVVDQVRRRLASGLRATIGPFQVDSRSRTYCRLQFRSTVWEELPGSIQRLEKIPLLASKMLVRRLEEIEGVRSVKFIEAELQPPLLQF